MQALPAFLLSLLGLSCKIKRRHIISKRKTAIWQKGRQLKSFNGVSFEYNGKGTRTKKGSIAFTYDSQGRLISQSNGLEFEYDATGVLGVKYNGNYYVYRKDVQGNVIALLDNLGRSVVQYVYDAWGNHAVLDINGKDITSATHIGTLNPFRYRGYYYDTETGLYYLQTRYYDPELCRFMTIDGIEYVEFNPLSGHNLYAYCGNNPVMNVDPTGTIFWFFIGLMALGAVANGAFKAVSAMQSGADGGQIALSFLSGAIQGAAMGACLGLGGLVSAGIMGMGMALTGSALIGAASGLTSYAIDSAAYGQEISFKDLLNAMNSGIFQGVGTMFIGLYGGAGGAFGNLAKRGTYAYAAGVTAQLGLTFSWFSSTVLEIGSWKIAEKIATPLINKFAAFLTTSLPAILYRLIIKGIFG